MIVLVIGAISVRVLSWPDLELIHWARKLRIGDDAAPAIGTGAEAYHRVVAVRSDYSPGVDIGAIRCARLSENDLGYRDKPS